MSIPTMKREIEVKQALDCSISKKNQLSEEIMESLPKKH